ncbi:nuclear pore complex protein DDB_G0274915 [Diachasma alloeum]|uniref:nuclear pore complex protein DDB_G0274915 n=1 Tax=Diachasma alloeum TaxID=454923 RepID=UPI0007383EC4|nr:nuclear pore complex protein DDB_G0274915 [Diachasma alloeum]
MLTVNPEKMSFFWNRQTITSTPSGNSPDKTTREASKTGPKIFSFGETQTKSPRSQSERSVRKAARPSLGTIRSSSNGSTPGNSPGAKTTSPSASTGYDFFAQSKPSFFFGPTSTTTTAATGSTAGENAPPSSGIIFGQPASTSTTTSASTGFCGSPSTGLNLKDPVTTSASVGVIFGIPTSKFAGFNFKISPATSATAGLFGTLTSQSTGFSLNNPAATSVSTEEIFGTPANPSTGFNLNGPLATPVSTGSCENSANPSTELNWKIRIPTPVSTCAVFETSTSQSTGFSLNDPLATPLSTGFFGTPESQPTSFNLKNPQTTSAATESTLESPASSAAPEFVAEVLKLILERKMGISTLPLPVKSVGTLQVSLGTFTLNVTSTASVFAGNKTSSSEIGLGQTIFPPAVPFTGPFGTLTTNSSTGFNFMGITGSAASTGTSEITGASPGTSATSAAPWNPTLISFSFTPIPHTTSSTRFTFFEASMTNSAESGFGSPSSRLPEGLSLRNTTAPTSNVAVTNTSATQASLGSITTATNSSLDDKLNDIHISNSESDSDQKSKVLKDPKSRKFTTTFECFFPLVDNDYWINATREPKFQENVSLSMYRYYMTQHLYARLVQIRAAKGLATNDEINFASHVQSVAPSVPLGIFTYLKTIGDIEVMEKGDHTSMFTRHFFEYCFLTWPNNKGHFGQLCHDNHWKYMSFPAPAIVTQAIEKDLEMDELNPQSIWDLRDDLKPSLSRNIRPTANLLGWKPATVLTIPQRQKLQLCGIFQNSFDVINSQFQFNPKIMTITHDYVKSSMSPHAIVNVEAYYENKPLNLGGIEQLAWLKRPDEEKSIPYSKTFASVERNVEGMLHPLQSSYSSELSLIMGFRVDKSKGGDDWVVYESGNYLKIPWEWIATRNQVFQFGDIGRVQGRAIPFSSRRDAVRHEFLVKCYRGVRMHE